MEKGQAEGGLPPAMTLPLRGGWEGPLHRAALGPGMPRAYLPWGAAAPSCSTLLLWLGLLFVCH